jgi:hypothetical protein
MHPGERYQVMMTVGCWTILGHLDFLANLHAIDGADALAIGRVDLHVLLDLGCIDYRELLNSSPHAGNGMRAQPVPRRAQRTAQNAALPSRLCP